MAAVGLRFRRANALYLARFPEAANRRSRENGSPRSRGFNRAFTGASWPSQQLKGAYTRTSNSRQYRIRRLVTEAALLARYFCLNAALPRRPQDRLYVSMHRAIPLPPRGATFVCAGRYLGLSPRVASAQGRLEAHYEATLAGIPVGKGYLGDRDRRRQCFPLPPRARTAGLLKAFAGGNGSGASQGRIVAARWSRSSYTATITTSKKSETIRISLLERQHPGNRDRAGAAGRSRPRPRHRRAEEGRP